MSVKKDIIDCLFDSIKEYKQDKYIAFLKKDAHKNKLLSESPSKLMTMWIMSAAYDAEKSSEIPFTLEKRLGSCELVDIASKNLSEIEQAMTYPTAIHRFAKKRAGYLHEMAMHVVKEYDGNAANIWADKSSVKIRERLLKIKGFGKKLSSMVLINLIRNFNMKFSDPEAMDVAIDVHVARVLKRTEIATLSDDYDTMASAIMNKAQQKGRYAYELDLPLWATGKFFCHEIPNCPLCPLTTCCAKNFLDEKYEVLQPKGAICRKGY